MDFEHAKRIGVGGEAERTDRAHTHTYFASGGS